MSQRFFDLSSGVMHGCCLLTLTLLTPGAAAAPVAIQVAGPQSAGSAIHAPAAPDTSKARILRGRLSHVADSLVTTLMERYDVPGTVLTVFDDGEAVLNRGWGTADMETARPVNANETLFRVASVSKIFTTAAALRLVERDVLSLDADLRPVLAELDIRLPFDAPVTLHHLLTHTSGFDNSDISDATWHEQDVVPAGEFLKERGINQPFPPGRYWRYSNYNMMLVAHLIEQAVGIPFEDFMEREILGPLGMDHSTFRQPPRDRLHTSVATAYDEGVVVEQDLSRVSPAGGLSTTGQDMARFVAALLSAADSERILSDESLDLMLSPRFSYHPSVAGQAYGFREMRYGEERWLPGTRRMYYHPGSRPGFSSELVLIPDTGTAIFISANSRRSSFTYNVVAGLIRAFFPGQSLDAPVAVANNHGMSKWAGTYRDVSFPRGTHEKFGGFFIKRFYDTVTATGDGRLRVDDEGILIPTGGGMFAYESTGEPTGFRSAGGTDFVFWRHFAFEKVAWYETHRFMWIAFIGFNLTFLSILLVWPIAGRRRGIPLGGASGRLTRRATIFASAIALLFLAGLVASTEAVDSSQLFDHGTPAVFSLLFALPLLVGLTGMAAVAGMHRLWTAPETPVWARIHTVIFIAAAMTFLWWTSYWNLMTL